ncbi:heparanase isoform X1 [Amphiprion ocellaris]|uniref:Heparanase n=1 Tax=Amphiprion ocellaris TaxID=80972 RepID=A0AAQ5ZXE3_AMPOC|nr:heparanase isoform X1 [Amphiprion ocellaris]XP_054860038.1 heparanase isoform X1 [Amphiprion ocellaris]XP_054860039.1 heparanase isoform X1 [Amphiprion ocellaris]XP_054860040.1 heparanase isoform X1 [Amphiprion ocellaris]XP_054860041.1 heparanase isoform X1 [Amphiprion ocellaris]XP_054860042.1 heparanase isoform X1 [Amphiprion ocellaris]XP_054860043.1 heparanase isoform X1 [Amphiprion ocellaris]XP_054860046.1 heparanase isoform X1 [Amphiprion ocellaris]
MNFLLLLSLISLRTHGTRTGPDGGWALDPDPVQELDLDLVLEPDLSAVLRRVDPRFLSVTIDASLAAEESFMALLSSSKVRTLSSALSPSFLRFGGTRQDFMKFKPQRRKRNSKNPGSESCQQLLPWVVEKQLKMNWTLQQQILIKEDLKRKFKKISFTEVTVDLLNSFSSCCGFNLIFGLNALLRTSENVWNSSNAETLIKYCQSRRYRMNWELGNEPNSFEKKAGIRVDGHQLGLDFLRLRELMSRSGFYRDAGLFGPDVGQPRDHRTDILGGFLQTGAEAVDAVTWHHYYVNGRDTSLEDFLDPEILDTLTSKTNEVMEKVKLLSPTKPIWLGETSSAYGGGAVGLSDTFVAGFMWLDKLGLGATLGLDVVMRQVLVGSGSYHLLDENLDPLPDYWLSLLYKRLVGPEVLKVRKRSGSARSKRVRTYLHCSNEKSYSRGSVTLISMNLNQNPSRISVPLVLSSSSLEAFILQSDRLDSRSVKLNGRLLQMLEDETLPDLRGTRLPPSDLLQLPGFSLNFFVFLDVQAAACL